MKFIFAQGNPGLEYAKTRHNVGFMALDVYADKNGAAFKPKSKFIADIAELAIDGEKALLIKPSTFYNETGRCARAILDFYKESPENFLVIHDELALPLGTLRAREKGSDAGNNGIKSLNAHIGESYGRIRVGIANDSLEYAGAHDFVLGTFSQDEAKTLERTILPKITELIDDFVRGTHQVTSHSLL